MRISNLEIRNVNDSSRTTTTMCLYCKGVRMICGKTKCHLLAKITELLEHHTRMEPEKIQGATPPGVFVGNYGYPKVEVGPLIPPYYNNTEILDAPERWIGKHIWNIIDYRYSLIRGKFRTNVFEHNARKPFLRSLIELAMAAYPVDTEATFKNKPDNRLVFSTVAQPFGPSASIKTLKFSSIKVDRRIEKAYYDKDLKTIDAMLYLYYGGISINKIQRALSMGILGVGGRRKLVPTRWSITAVDNCLSTAFLEKVKQFETINEYRVYRFRNLENIFVALLSPEKWKFEWIEAWFPGTTWNEKGLQPAIMGDHELYGGRTTYASIGGCYYSARLALAERLMHDRKQASAIILREIHPSYFLPVGVWNVRESLRSALRNKPVVFNSFNSAVKHASSILTIPLNNWIEKSVLMKRALFQKKISKYL